MNTYTSDSAAPPAYPISALGQLRMTVTAGATDTLVMTVGAASYSVTTTTSVLGLQQAWNTIEYGVFGCGNLLEAQFLPKNSTSLEVSVAIEATYGTSLQCGLGPTGDEGYTGESNNLNLICCDTGNLGGLAGITALESNVPGVTSAACAAPNPWIKLPGGGCASNIAAADGDYPWITGCATTGNPAGRNTIWYWGGSSTGWVETTNGSAKNISAWNDPVDYWNYPTIVGTNGMVYWGNPGVSDVGSSAGRSVTWAENLHGSATGTSISTSGYNLTGDWSNYISGGSDVLYYSEDYAAWSAIGSPQGVAEWISVAPDNSSLWALTSAGGAYEFTGTLNPAPGSGTWAYSGLSNVNQVAAGPGYSYAYIQSGALTLYRTETGPVILPTGGTGEPVLGPNPGGWGTQLSIGANGNVWVIDGSGSIWEYVPQSPIF